MFYWSALQLAKADRGAGSNREQGCHRDTFHVQVELVGQVAQGEGSAGAQGCDVHVGDEVIILRHHLQREVGPETIAAQTAPQAVHHSCADCQLVLACALACNHTQDSI